MWIYTIKPSIIFFTKLFRRSISAVWTFSRTSDVIVASDGCKYPCESCIVLALLCLPTEQGLPASLNDPTEKKQCLQLKI